LEIEVLIPTTKLFIFANYINYYIFSIFYPAGPETIEWLINTTGVPVIDHWWTTETSIPITENSEGIDKILYGNLTPGCFIIIASISAVLKRF
jgi:acyl-coenzyme A synthetase/AMP-(fatty) acid ligase